MMWPGTESMANINDVKVLKEALNYVRTRVLRLADADYNKASAMAKDVAFTLPGVGHLGVLNLMREGIEQSLGKGTGYQEFKQRLLEALRKELGLQESVQILQSLTMNVRGSTRDQILRAIYDSNISRALNAGLWSVCQQAHHLGQLNLVLYTAKKAGHHCRRHIALDGIVRDFEDPIWKIIWPPNGVNCQCSVEIMTTDMAESLGISKSSDANFNRRIKGTPITPRFAVAPGISNSVPHIHKELEMRRRKHMQANPSRIGGISLQIPEVWERESEVMLDALKSYESLDRHEKIALRTDFGAAVELLAVRDHSRTGREKILFDIGVMPVRSGDWAGMVVSAGPEDIKLLMRSFYNQRGGLIHQELTRKRVPELIKRLPDLLRYNEILVYTPKNIWLKSEHDIWFRFSVYVSETKEKGRQKYLVPTSVVRIADIEQEGWIAQLENTAGPAMMVCTAAYSVQNLQLVEA